MAEQHRKWTDQDIRNMLAKRSIVPPADEYRPSRWYWIVSLTLFVACLIGAFCYGVIAR